MTYVARFNNDDEISTWGKWDTGSWRIEDGRLILSGTGVGKLMGVLPTTNFTSDLDISFDTEWLGGVGGYSYGILFRKSSKGQYGFGTAATEGYNVYEWDEDWGSGSDKRLFLPKTQYGLIAKERVGFKANMHLVIVLSLE